MAGYQRNTALSPSEVLAEVEGFLPEMVGLSQSKICDHSATYNGTEGCVTVTAHRHRPYTDVVMNTDRLRTSRLGYEVQRLLNRLGYETGYRGYAGSGEPT